MENNSDIEKAAKAYADKVMSLVENTVITKATFLDLKDMNKQAYIQGRLDEKAVLPDLSELYNDLNERINNLKTKDSHFSWLSGRLSMLHDLYTKDIISLKHINES